MKKLLFTSKKVLSFLMATITALGILGTTNNIMAVFNLQAYASENIYKPVAPSYKEPVYKYSVKNGEAIITEYEGTEDEIVIPDMIDGYKVVGIGDNVFSLTFIKSVTIPDTVESIGQGAFLECNFLTDVIIPDSVTTIGACAFQYCPNLKSIELPYSIDYIGIDAFYESGIYNDPSNWEDDVLYIGNHLIVAKNSISGEYKIQGNTTTISENAFAECKNLTGVVIPEGVRIICDGAFEYCTSLSEITIPDGVETIGTGAFAYCTSLSEITIPDGVETIGAGAFLYCTSLSEITIPDSVTSIGRIILLGSNFYDNYENWEAGCLYVGNHLIKIEEAPEPQYNVRENTITIADEALESMTNKNLDEIFIPETVSYIGKNINFNLVKITVSEDNPFYSNDEYGILYNKDKTILISCPQRITETNYEIPDGVEIIGDYAFSMCKNLSNITCSDSVKSIGEGAFSLCSALEKVVFSHNLEYIGEMAFTGCENISEIIFPESLRSIGEKSFVSCKKLTSLTIPDGVLSIGRWSFAGCQNIEAVTISASVKNIENSVFSGCKSLKKIVVSENNQFYSSDEHGVLFDKDKTILITYPIANPANEYTIPDTAATIALGAFNDSDNLKSITIPLKASYPIYASSFSNCDNLSDIYFMGTIDRWNKVFVLNNEEALADVTIHYRTNLSPENNDNVVVEFFDNCFDGEVKAKVIEKNKDSNFLIYEEVDGRLVYRKLLCKYEISMIAEDGKEVQPKNGTVTVKIKLSDGYADIKKEKISILHYWDKEPGNEKILSDRIEIKNGYVIFDVNHFSDFYVCLEIDIPTIKIRNNPVESTVNYGDILSLTAETANMSEGMQAVWYVNGEKTATGNTFKSEFKKDTEIIVKITDLDGNIITDKNGGEVSDSQRVTVKDNLWLRIVSFFKNLFGISRLIEQ